MSPAATFNVSTARPMALVYYSTALVCYSMALVCYSAAVVEMLKRCRHRRREALGRLRK